MSFSNPHAQNTHAILFVDDEEKARKMFTRLVSPQFTVLTAADVKEAKEVLDKHHHEIGVLITDQRMPGELGVDLLRYIRKEHPKIIRLLTTAYTDLDDAIEAVNTGEIFRYINKPWNADELLIDLNLAMNFFIIEQDRQQLIQEKMSLSHRQSRIEIMKSLISMSAAQSHFNTPKQAIRSFLEQVAEPQILAEQNATPDTRSYWENEVSKTEKMISINQSLNEGTEQAQAFISDADSMHSIDYQSCIDQVKGDLSITISVDAIDSDIAQSQTVLNQQGVTALLGNMITALADSDVSISISQQDQDIQIVAKASQPSSRFASQFLTTGDESQDKQLGQMLAAYILVSHVGGKIRMNFDDSTLSSIEATLPTTFSEGQNDMQDGMWIEDLFVLYS